MVDETKNRAQHSLLKKSYRTLWERHVLLSFKINVVASDISQFL